MSTYTNLCNDDRASVVHGVVQGHVHGERGGRRQTDRHKTCQINLIRLGARNFGGNGQRRKVFSDNDCDVENESDVGKGRGGVERKAVIPLVVLGPIR